MRTNHRSKPAIAEGSRDPCHEQASVTAFKFVGGVDVERLEFVGQFHRRLGRGQQKTISTRNEQLFSRAIFDTYDELWHEDDGTGSESIIEFYKDKRFMQDEVGGCCKRVGIWRFAEDERELTLRYTDGSNRDLSYEVRELSAGELELAWPGRHGPVIERYRPK